jgi:hypothetical protein
MSVVIPLMSDRDGKIWMDGQMEQPPQGVLGRGQIRRGQLPLLRHCLQTQGR